MSALPTLGQSTDDATSSGSTVAASSAGTGTRSGSTSATDSAAGSNTSSLPSIGASSSGTATSASSSASVSNTITGAPSLSTDSGSVSHLTGLPTLSGAYSYPPPSVPPTSNAPYMQSSNLPESFVFIVVGAFIAFVAIVIISWRILTSWSINRRFKRDAAGNAVYTPLADFKQKNASTSLANLTATTHVAGAKGGRPTNQSSNNLAADPQTLPKSFSSVPNLFFSPTAEVARQSTYRPQSQYMPQSGQQQQQQQQQQYLPSGHYRDVSDPYQR